MAVANKIASELLALVPGIAIDHFPLVGTSASREMNEVGPRRAMPSGGLIAMGQVGNIVRDIKGGLLALTLAQRRFLVKARGVYDRAIAIGDVYALLMTLAQHAPTTYIGTAKSVRVAPYGPMERRVLRRADEVFVRDEETARTLRDQGVDAQAPGNTIVDLFAEDDDARVDDLVAGFAPAIAIFPGSRDGAYADGAFLLRVLHGLSKREPRLGAIFSIAPGLDAQRFIASARNIGFAADDPRLRFWTGPLGPVLRRVQLVIGQAGTANEAAAAAGVPVIAFELGKDRKTAWYRMRQGGLLGDALMVLPGDEQLAVDGIVRLLHDEDRRVHMGSVGRERMGAPGGSRAIAQAIAARLA